MKVAFNKDYALDMMTVLGGLKDSLDRDKPANSLGHAMAKDARLQLFHMSYSVFESFLRDIYKLSGKNSASSQTEELTGAIDLLMQGNIIAPDYMSLLLDMISSNSVLWPDIFWLDAQEEKLFNQHYANIENYYGMMHGIVSFLMKKGTPHTKRAQ